MTTLNALRVEVEVLRAREMKVLERVSELELRQFTLTSVWLSIAAVSEINSSSSLTKQRNRSCCIGSSLFLFEVNS